MSNIHMQLTAKGQALNAKIKAGKGKVALDITRVVFAAGTSENPLDLDDVINPRLAATITDRKVFGIRAAITIIATNQGNPFANPPVPPVLEGFALGQIGMYAIDPDEGEILYRISQFSTPNYIPAATEMGWTIEPTWNFVTENAKEVNVHIDPNGLATIRLLADSIAAHNKDETAHENRFAQIRAGLEALAPIMPIVTIPITKADYFASWSLFTSAGGITAPLADWGFTNATLTEIPSRITLDINTNQITLYATSDFAGTSWAAQQYQDGLWLLTAADVAADAAMVLVRS
jgi:hypothetical protein